MSRRLLAVLFAFSALSSAHAAAERLSIEGGAGPIAVVAEVTPVFEDAGAGPVAILCHGFASDKDYPLLGAVAKTLLDRGVSVVRFDFRGHGESGGDFAAATVSGEIDDLRRVYEWTAGQRWCACVYFVGHSQGGVVAAMGCGLGMTGWEKGKDAGIHGAVLLAPAAMLPDDARRGRLFDASFDPLDPPERLALAEGGVEVGRDYLLDVQNLKIYETAALVRKRAGWEAAVIHGSADTVVAPSWGERFARTWAGREWLQGEFHLLFGADHAFSGREEEVAELVLHCLQRSFAPGPFEPAPHHVLLAPNGLTWDGMASPETDLAGRFADAAESTPPRRVWLDVFRATDEAVLRRMVATAEGAKLPRVCIRFFDPPL